ncbi:30S ribosomal protein S4 [Candidatus Giovannonibacteria bacterium RIFCSPLOWO2_01_FULL_43_160]|uniref:Small ribosomal subunit protein uS4 n=2 Tax=Candidatus Giovannoniibacteriota TaxID=1752738 RepID=A0A1F5XVC5_9BACT|nr:MAG: 30S ribosomal protein S4 [Candidatus Giovannonibacteria bacterium RIFCSPHIGHO2_01_FULL_43_140]OGF70686.1 MAG: 30S ribosomal protein S4 [Candidatus Giovannonibacteria bacterium RIFCSPHIGHO2_02_FULL_44_51]OGF72445.1 MAG: 30S ribosomal protein S4 [Candidatus Giovannonibacteria bacterium RIFCSPHIGHO2_12_FULL_44_22]OGF76098.1 MAG: 30S ribosomal protein S4 [Candidatus Giovannonibacteria bacterium RIFCSPLOWO2_01_FULL_43_160]OGF85744.1 MAG: 30S ribosomal protein S4 [Candidatus Giovannonibacteri
MRTTITCKMCRRLGMSICGREKCALKRKPYPPGIHGKSFRRGLSEFGQQLKEKQKVKFLYGLRETQFRNYIDKAVAQRAIPSGEAIIRNLEMRLDNIIYRLGFAPTRAGARQMVNHGHILVNEKRVNIPSYKLKMGDAVVIRPGSLQKGVFMNLAMTIKKYAPPEWLELDKTSYAGKVIAYPSTDALIRSYNLSSIVEYYSR